MPRPLTVPLHLEPNEASDLATIDEPGLLAAEGWDLAYLTVLDEGRVEDCIAVLGHEAGAPLDSGWSSHRLRFTPTGDGRRTEDAEAIAVCDGVAWVFGSHFGSKSGPLQPRRQFVARFPLEALGDGLHGARPPLEVARTRFRLHRAINDALQSAAIDVLPLGDAAREAFVDATVAKGREGGKRWAEHARLGDWPLNIEGAAFRPDGTLLIGLRFPVTAAGHPILVEVRDAEALFAQDDPPPATGAVWWLDGVGDEASPAGIRALHHSGADTFQAVVGSLDADGKDSVLLDAHPEGGASHSQHWTFTLPALASGGPVPARLVHGFDGLRRVEGVADGPDGHALYVVDEESHVDLRFLLVE
jgi:hypothetical protein